MTHNTPRKVPNIYQSLLRSWSPTAGQKRGGVMQSLQVVNSMRTCLMNLAAVVRPLRKLLERLLIETKDTKRVESCPVLREEGWATDRAAA